MKKYNISKPSRIQISPDEKIKSPINSYKITEYLKQSIAF